MLQKLKQRAKRKNTWYWYPERNLFPKYGTIYIFDVTGDFKAYPKRKRGKR